MAARLKASLDAQSRQQQRQELIAGMSHDLKSPLTSIRAYTEGLLDGVAKDEAARTQFKLCLKILYLFLSVWSILRHKGSTAQFGKQIRREIFRQAKI